jgi:molybdenum cofactor cytidylyltransferase
MGVGAVLLAAGEAKRMGRLKQLLPYRGRTLLEHAIAQAQAAEFTPVVVVLGAQAEVVAEVVGRTSASWVVNRNWQSGMGSSLTTGVAKALEIEPGLNGIAVLLADQPCITATQLSEMWAEFEKVQAPIVAASYAGTVGVPAIFRSSVFGKLKQLPLDAGARQLLRGGEAEIHRYELPAAATDVDTPEDFAELG